MKILEAIKKQQREILFGLTSYYTKKEGLCMNPFYGGEESDIKKDVKYTKEIYAKVFKSHLAFLF